MIYGIGIDIVKLARIERLYNTYEDAFVQKVLSQPEYLGWVQSPTNHPVEYLAKRFAAKEAFAKAVKTGLRYPVSLSNITLVHDNYGKPEFIFEKPLQSWLKDRKIGNIHISISDEEDNAVAFAIAEYEE